MKLKKGQVLARQGHPIDRLFIVKSGELLLTKRVDGHARGDFYDAEWMDGAALNTRGVLGRAIPLGLCGKRELLGEEFVFNPQNVFEYSIECASSLTVVLSFKSSILRALPHRFQDLWRELYLQKRQNRLSQFQSSLAVVLGQRRGSSLNLFSSQVKNPGLAANLTNAENHLSENVTRMKKLRALKGELDQAFQRIGTQSKGCDANELIDFQHVSHDVRTRPLHAVQLAAPVGSPQRRLFRVKSLLTETHKQLRDRSPGQTRFFTITRLDTMVLKRKLSRA